MPATIPMPIKGESAVNHALIKQTNIVIGCARANSAPSAERVPLISHQKAAGQMQQMLRP